MIIIFISETQLEVLYPTIRRKLGFALNNLQPLDYSPHVILKPWAKVRVFFSGEVERVREREWMRRRKRLSSVIEKRDHTILLSFLLH